MQKGSFLSKVRPNKLYKRTYFLSEDLTSLRWEPSKKRFEESKFLVSDVKKVLLVRSPHTLHTLLLLLLLPHPPLLLSRRWRQATLGLSINF